MRRQVAGLESVDAGLVDCSGGDHGIAGALAVRTMPPMKILVCDAGTSPLAGIGS